MKRRQNIVLESQRVAWDNVLGLRDRIIIIVTIRLVSSRRKPLGRSYGLESPRPQPDSLISKCKGVRNLQDPAESRQLNSG